MGRPTVARQRRRTAAPAGLAPPRRVHVARGRGRRRRPRRGRPGRRRRSTSTSTIDDIIVSGTVAVPWHGACRRCLAPARRDAASSTSHERYADGPGRRRRCVPDRARPDRPRRRWSARRSCSPSPTSRLCRDRLPRAVPELRRRSRRRAVLLRRRPRSTSAGRRSTSCGPTDRRRAGVSGSPLATRPITCNSPKSPDVGDQRWPFPRRRSRSRRAAAVAPAPGSSRRPARSLCPRCGNAKVPHTVCPTCGWYKNRVAVDVA